MKPGQEGKHGTKIDATHMHRAIRIVLCKATREPARGSGVNILQPVKRIPSDTCATHSCLRLPCPYRAASPNLGSTAQRRQDTQMNHRRKLSFLKNNKKRLELLLISGDIID